MTKQFKKEMLQAKSKKTVKNSRENQLEVELVVYIFFKKWRWYQWKICHWNCIILRWNGHFDVGIDLVVRLLRTMKLSKRHKNIWLRNLYYAKCLFQLLKDFDHRYRTSWRRQPWNCPKAKWQFLPSFLPTFLLLLQAINTIHVFRNVYIPYFLLQFT